MANFYASYPVGSGGAAGSNPSVGPNGALIPLDSTLVGGESPTGTLQPLQTDASGNLLVSLAAEPGAPVAVNITEYGGVLTTLGQKASVASQPVVFASDQSPLTVVQGTPANLLSQVSQPTASLLNATVVQGTAANLNATVVQGTAANLNATVVQSSGVNLHVNVDNFPATQPVSGTVAVTQSTSPWVDNISQIGGGAVQTGHGTAAGSLRVELPTDGTGVVGLNAGSNIIGNVRIDQTTPGTTNGMSLAEIGATAILSGNGVTGAGSQRVTIASDNTPFSVNAAGLGNTPLQFIRNAYASTNVTTAAYVQLIASTSGISNVLELFDSSGQTLKIAFGGAGSEVDQFIVFPGGNGRITCKIPASTRVSIKALSATANSGEIDLNLYT